MRSLLLFILACLVFAGGYAAVIQPYLNSDWKLPAGFPPPAVPPDNPMSDAKTDLGRHLFYDDRLSANEKQSCSTCHRQELAFTDGRKVAIGSSGQAGTRHAMTLVNVAYSGALTWSDPGDTRLEDQALVPMFGRHPVELGLNPDGRFLNRLKADANYRRLFANAFPSQKDPFSVSNVVKALACFERTIISANSPYDRYHYGGDDSAVTEAAKRGEVLFYSEPLKCFHCHGGFNFTDATVSTLSSGRKIEFQNTGLYNLAGSCSYPAADPGLYGITKNRTDIGKFKAPTLRNVAVTGPYMHDGSIATLSEVIDHYAAGGRAILSGPDAGDGSRNPNKDPQIQGFKISARDKADLIAFLESLTDDSVLHDPRFSNPFH